MTVATDGAVVTPAPLVLDILETADTLRCGRTTVYALIKEGELESVKIGRRQLITYASVADFVARRAMNRRDADPEEHLSESVIYKDADDKISDSQSTSTATEVA